MCSAKVETTELSFAPIPITDEGAYGAFVGNFNKGPVGKPIFISSVDDRDRVIGIPQVGSDIAYYIHEIFLSKSQKSWVIRVAVNPYYGGASIGATFVSILGTGNGVTTDYTGYAYFNRCHQSSLVIYVGNEKVAYDNGSKQLIGSTLTGTVNYYRGRVKVQFSNPPTAGAKIYAVWGTPNLSLEQGLPEFFSYGFDERLIEQRLVLRSIWDGNDTSLWDDDETYWDEV